MYNASAATGAQPQRRQNTSCDPCRRSKRRCVRPTSGDGRAGAICINCDRLGYSCTFNFAQSRLKSTPKRKRRQSSGNPGASIEPDKLNLLERPTTDATGANPELDCMTNSDILASWLDLDFGSGLDDSLPYLPSTSIFPDPLGPASLESRETVEIEHVVSAGITPNRSRTQGPELSFKAGSIVGSSLNSPVQLLYSKLDATMLDDRLIRIYNAIVTGSSSRFLSYDCNLFASGHHYKLENNECHPAEGTSFGTTPCHSHDSSAQGTAQNLSSMSSDCSVDSPEAGQSRLDHQVMSTQSTDNRMTMLGIVRFLDHFSDIYGNRLGKEARRKSNEVLNAVLRTFALQWLPSDSRDPSQETWNSPPNVFVDAWFQARSLIQETESIVSFKVAYAVMFFDGISMPVNTSTGSIMPHEFLDIGLQKLQHLDGLVTRYCENLGPSSRYGALLQASLNIVRWGAYVRDTGAALTADRQCKLPDASKHAREPSIDRPSAPWANYSHEELDTSVPGVCRTAFSEAFFAWRQIINARSLCAMEGNNIAGLPCGANDSIKSAVAAVGTFNEWFRPFMDRCMDTFQHLSIGSKMYSVSFSTVWNLGVFVLAETLDRFSKKTDYDCDLYDLSNMRIYQQEAILSTVRTVDSVLKLPTEVAFNVQNGLSADVPIIAYHITPGLMSCTLKKAVEQIISLHFPTDAVAGSSGNMPSEGAWSHQLDVLTKGLVSLGVTVGGSQTAGVALQSLMQRFGDILSECWSCEIDP